MTKSERKAYEFESLVCKMQALAIESKGMEADNAKRLYKNEPPEWDGEEFRLVSDKMWSLADDFIKLRDQ